jgi:alkylation response protein AidB-like acyl-CoA dehydrogenase
MSLRYAYSQKRAGKRLFDHQLVQLKINEMSMLTEALRSFVMRIAWEHDQGKRSATGVLAVNYSTDVIIRVTKLNMEIHGRKGGMMNSRVDKLVRDAMVWTHLAGDTVLRLKAVSKIKPPEMSLAAE